MRDNEPRRLRMARAAAHPPGMEPVARVVREAMDAAGMNQAAAAKATGLKPQHIEQIVNRKKPYSTRPPKIETLQALAKLPGLTRRALDAAVAESTGIGVVIEVEPISSARRSAHALVDKFPEDQLPRVVQILITLLD